jgi:mono/diheme cytochrome c family protein
MNGFNALLGSTIVFVAAVAVHGTEVRDRDASWTAPTVATSKPNPLSGRRDVVAGGRKVFQQRCTTCHGEDGRGSSEGPDLTLPEVQMQSDGELFWKISSGNSRAGMPTFSFLPEPQRWQVVMQLREFAR